MFSTRSVTLAAILGWALLTTPVAGAAEKLEGNFLDDPSPKWRQGPVRYFLTEEEDDLFQRLKTKEERSAFIYRFWLLRDPTPATPANEFKGEFRQRVLDANRLFGDTSKPGWKTDMGKVYILLGPPDEQRREEVARTHRGVAVWTYRSLPHTTLGPNVVIAFARDTKGEFVLSTAPTLDAEVAGLVHMLSRDPTLGMSQAEYIKQYGRDPLLLAAGAPTGMSELELQGNIAEIMHLPPPKAILDALVTAEAYFDAIPFSTRVDFFRAGDGGTRLTITLGVSATAVVFRRIDGRDRPDVHVFARLLDPETEATVHDLSAEGAFHPSPGNDAIAFEGDLVFQAGQEVAPGPYTLLIGLEDRGSGRVATARQRIQVPDLQGAGLRLSSLTVAERLDPLEAPAAADPADPFVIGDFQVVPKPRPEFRREETLRVYFQVYGADPDPGTGEPDLEITYTFQRREGEGFVPFRVETLPDARSDAQQFAAPLGNWPAGDYRLEVTVRDLRTGATATAATEFRIL